MAGQGGLMGAYLRFGAIIRSSWWAGGSDDGLCTARTPAVRSPRAIPIKLIWFAV